MPSLLWKVRKFDFWKDSEGSEDGSGIPEEIEWGVEVFKSRTGAGAIEETRDFFLMTGAQEAAAQVYNLIWGRSQNRLPARSVETMNQSPCHTTPT
jgi:hypothetical protein